MEISYWQSRWNKHKTGWHMDEVFPPLKKYWQQLDLSTGATVLVPLCGKSLDLQWLISQGHNIIGVDVSEVALKQVMQQNNISFDKSSKGPFTIFSSDSIELWCGDVLKLQQQWLPPIDAVYDKAALIALPEDMRTSYAKNLQSLLQPHSQIFINCFEYEQKEMPGPPFAVFTEELKSLFGQQFHINRLYAHSLFNTLTKFHRRGLHSYLTEKVYHLAPK